MRQQEINVLNPFDGPMKVKPQRGWLYVRVLDKHETRPELGLVGPNGEDVASQRIILAEGETRDSMRVAAVVLETSEPGSEKDERVEVGQTIMYAPVVRPVPVPWSPKGTEFLLRYECVVATLSELDDLDSPSSP